NNHKSNWRMKMIKCTSCMLLTGVVIVGGSFALAQANLDERVDETKKAATPTAPAADDQSKLPPGWTMEDMMVCVEAGTPGDQHGHLAYQVGVCDGQSSMWMMPDSEPMTSECVSNVTTIMDGRYTRVELEGEMPGMGRFQ